MRTIYWTVNKNENPGVTKPGDFGLEVVGLVCPRFHIVWSSQILARNEKATGGKPGVKLNFFPPYDGPPKVRRGQSRRNNILNKPPPKAAANSSPAQDRPGPSQDRGQGQPGATTTGQDRPAAPPPVASTVAKVQAPPKPDPGAEKGGSINQVGRIPAGAPATGASVQARPAAAGTVETGPPSSQVKPPVKPEVQVQAGSKPTT